MVIFKVDDVTPAAEPLPTRPLRELFADSLVVGGDPELPLLVPDGVQPVLSAVGRAFAEHRPLVLTPDAIWLTITQGLAQHVRLNAEKLRPQLVVHAGRKRLMVVVDGSMPDDPATWQEAVASFAGLLGDEIGHPDLFDCDFSTSTDVDRVAGQIVMLDAYSPYFAAWLMFVCGIPSITLTGTVDDWQRIRNRVETLADLDLETWCRSLRPILDQFVRAAEGDVDTAFWQRIYSPADAYGGEVVTGWAARLYPYVEHDGVFDHPNPLLDLPIREPRNVTVTREAFDRLGVRTDQVPATLSRVILNINDQIAGDNRAMALHGGLIGVAQDDGGALRPVAGWHLTPAAIEIDDVIDRIEREHVAAPPESESLIGDTDLVALYRRIGSATLFDGAWRLLPKSEHRLIRRGDHQPWLMAVADLADGRSIAFRTNDEAGTTHWMTCRIEPPAEGRFHRLLDEPADVPDYGTSLAMLLDAAMDADGHINHLITGTLAELEHPPPPTR